MSRQIGRNTKTHKGRQSLVGLISIAGAVVVACRSAWAVEIPAPQSDDKLSMIVVAIAGVLIGAAGFWALSKRRNRQPIDYRLDELKVFSATMQIGRWIAAFGAIGVIAIALANYGMTSGGDAPANTGSFLSLFGANLVTGGAAAAVGALLGFIFGIPRVVDPASRAAVTGAAAQAGPSVAPSVALASNTNLERISDWLTTLLIGATLVQIKEIAEWIGGLGGKLAAGAITNQTLIPIIVVYFFALSFLGIYLITRLYLTTALNQTLGFLAGSEGVSEPSAVKARLANAASTSDPSELGAAISFYRNSTLDEDQKADPELNTELARAAAKYLQTGKAPDSPVLKGLLRTAVSRASADQAQKAHLKRELESQSLRTGDEALDGEIATMLG